MNSPLSQGKSLLKIAVRDYCVQRANVYVYTVFSRTQGLEGNREVDSLYSHLPVLPNSSFLNRPAYQVPNCMTTHPALLSERSPARRSFHKQSTLHSTQNIKSHRYPLYKKDTHTSVLHPRLEYIPLQHTHNAHLHTPPPPLPRRLLLSLGPSRRRNMGSQRQILRHKRACVNLSLVKTHMGDVYITNPYTMYRASTRSVYTDEHEYLVEEPRTVCVLA
jgi:hypothetical protein